MRKLSFTKLFACLQRARAARWHFDLFYFTDVSLPDPADAKVCVVHI